MDQLRLKASDFVQINISNSQNDVVSFERKYPKDLTIMGFKNKLEVITGGCSATMKLELFHGDKMVCKLDDDSSLLGAYPIEDGMRVHVIDNNNIAIGRLENVPKFELSTDEYDKRQDSVKSFLKQNRLGKYNEEEMKKIEEAKLAEAEEVVNKASVATIGSRCKVTTKGQPTRLGTVMYNGDIEGRKGIFIGVKFDEPLGVNDGSSNGKQYFDCPPKYGSFVSPLAVEIGDFPPESDGLDDEI